MTCSRSASLLLVLYAVDALVVYRNVSYSLPKLVVLAQQITLFYQANQRSIGWTAVRLQSEASYLSTLHMYINGLSVRLLDARELHM